MPTDAASRSRQKLEYQFRQPAKQPFSRVRNRSTRLFRLACAQPGPAVTASRTSSGSEPTCSLSISRER